MRAFTLVEILAAMAVLVVLVLGLARAFNDAANAFRRGVITVERNGAVQIAMETIARDLEGAIVNERFGFYQEANTVDAVQFGFGFDEVWFVTTASDQDTAGQADPSAYHFVRYSVASQNVTHVGLSYVKFRLMRTTWKMQLLRSGNIDPMGANTAWWNAFGFSAVGITSDAILDNVIRFDIYLHDKNGNMPYLTPPGRAYFDSTVAIPPSAGLPDGYPSNQPPAAIDVYLQATSEETMRQAGLVLLRGANVGTQKKARAQMYRDSNMLTMRVTPFAAAGQWMYPAQFYY